MLHNLSFRPHLVRAFYEWCGEARMTPYLVAHIADAKTAGVPDKFLDSGRVTLNISPESVRNLAINAEGVFFTARFLGQTREVNIPIRDLLAVYAKEIREGVFFPAPTVAAAGGNGDNTGNTKAGVAAPRRAAMEVVQSTAPKTATRKSRKKAIPGRRPDLEIL